MQYSCKYDNTMGVWRKLYSLFMLMLKRKQGRPRHLELRSAKAFSAHFLNMDSVWLRDYCKISINSNSSCKLTLIGKSCWVFSIDKTCKCQMNSRDRNSTT